MVDCKKTANFEDLKDGYYSGVPVPQTLSMCYGKAEGSSEHNNQSLIEHKEPSISNLLPEIGYHSSLAV